MTHYDSIIIVQIFLQKFSLSHSQMFQDLRFSVLGAVLYKQLSYEYTITCWESDYMHL